MTSIILPPINPSFLAMVAAGEHLAGNPPAAAAPARLDDARRAVIRFLDSVALLNFSTAGPDGWPVAHCMHFATVVAEGPAPVIFMFTHLNTRKLTNIPANPRVSIMVLQSGGDAGGPARYLRMQGLAKLIDDPEEHGVALQSQFDKPDYQYTKLLGLEKNPALRVDITHATWTDEAHPEHSGLIDYAGDFPARATASAAISPDRM